MADIIPAWITFIRSIAIPRWQIVAFEYIDVNDPRNNGSTNIMVKVLDEQGKYKAGDKVWVAFPTDNPFEVMKPLGQGPEYPSGTGQWWGASFNQSGDSNFDPAKGQSGPYFAYMDNHQPTSDVVNGMGLPLRRHVQYLITFQRVSNPVPPPVGSWQVVSQSAVTTITSQSDTAMELVTTVHTSMQKK